MPTPAPLFLISCVAGKAAEPCEARSLYRSDWFLKARAYVEALGADWLILSAAHGLLDPRQPVKPYDATLHDMERADRQAWAASVMRQLRQRGQVGRPVVILAGERYREFLEPLILRSLGGDPALCQVPLRGLGIGEQKAALVRLAREARAERDALAGDAELDQLERRRVDLVEWFDQVGRAELSRADVVRYLGEGASQSQRDALKLWFELDRRNALLRLTCEREDLDVWIRARRAAIPGERADQARRKARLNRAARRLIRAVRQLAGVAFAPVQGLPA